MLLLARFRLPAQQTGRPYVILRSVHFILIHITDSLRHPDMRISKHPRKSPVLRPIDVPYRNQSADSYAHHAGKLFVDEKCDLLQSMGSFLMGWHRKDSIQFF